QHRAGLILDDARDGDAARRLERSAGRKKHPDRRREHEPLMVLCVPMRSALFRVTIGAIAWVAVGAAAYILFQSEQRIGELTASLQQFDLRARQATSALVEARVAQQAYVAAGQGIG